MKEKKKQRISGVMFLSRKEEMRPSTQAMGSDLKQGTRRKVRTCGTDVGM